MVENPNTPLFMESPGRVTISTLECVVISNTRQKKLALSGWYLKTSETQIVLAFPEDFSLESGSSLALVLRPRLSGQDRVEQWGDMVFANRRKETLLLCDSTGPVSQVSIF